MKIALITILIYSTILTIVNFVKNESSYSVGIETVDIVTSGPIMWIILLLLVVFKKPLSATYKYFQKRKEERNHSFSKKQIEKTVKKIIKNAKKIKTLQYYNFNRLTGDS